jgi:preprotein translocase subunit SecY
MNNTLPESEQLINEHLGIKVLDSYNYWSKKRLLFNILVGLAGLYPTIFCSFLFSMFDLFGILMWGFVANAGYSFGYVIESFVITKTNGVKSLSRYRNLLFWLGTISYVIVTISFGYLYFKYYSWPLLD